MKEKGLLRIIPAFGFCFLLMVNLNSCSDDSIDMNHLSDREIRFEISGLQESQGLNTTRSDYCKISKPSVLRLDGESKPLYLVPWVKEGINLKKSGNILVKTRGTLTNSDNLENAGVFAAQNQEGSGLEGLIPNYMYNVEINREGNWIPTEKYLWPGKGTLHINSYSPYCEVTGIEGVTGITAKGESLPVSISYVVPAAVDAQEDLLWGEPVDASSSPCKLTFNHALTAVRFVAGAEMSPCTIESIDIKGILSQGKLSLETGEWSEISGRTDYHVSPNVTLAAATGSQFVEAGSPITSDDDTFLLIPQDLGTDSRIVLTVNKDGKSYVLEAPLEGESWTQGTTITYRLSANPAKDELVLDVKGDFITNYTGETESFSVESAINYNGTVTPVDWKAEFVDESGNLVDQPNWITSFPMSGTGASECSYSTVMQDIVFNSISEQSRKLQNAENINSISGMTPYNLSNSNGGTSVENTANSYIINAPGKYSLPLVYGNGIKNGSNNTEAYASNSHNRYALKEFVNHLGKGITDPYIYNNSGCEPSDAVLVWEDELNLIRDVALSEDKKAITFDIPHNTIRQGNALIAVRDKTGTIMWSWQIWVTDYNPSSTSVNINVNGTNHTLYTRNLGSVVGGDRVTFVPSKVLVKFTQVNVPEGMEPLTKTVEVYQKGVTIDTGDYNTYYQWGRKDPMMSSVKQWYDASHTELTQLTVKNVQSDIPSGESLIECGIRTPDTFWETKSDYKYDYTNLWNSTLLSNGSVKTIYDPSPIGSKVPSGEEFLYLYQSGSFNWGTEGESKGFIITAPDMDGQLFFTALGYRSLSTGTEESNGITGEYWSARAATNREDATCLTMQHKEDGSIVLGHADYRGHAFGVRPAFE